MAASQRSRRWAGFRSILCPIDFSDHSRLALRYADTVAQRARGTLHVCYVNDPLLVAAASSRLHYPGLAIQSKRELRTFVETTLPRRSSTGRVLTVSALTGEPAGEILKAAERLRADLIVLGTHGLAGVERLFLGSTTLGVLQRTKVPVLAVPRAKGEMDSAPSPSGSWPGTRILAAVELDGDSPIDVKTAARIADWFGSSLLLIHVIAAPPAPSWLRGDPKGRQQMLVDKAEEQLSQLAATVGADIHVEGRVVCGGIAEELSAVVASEQIELATTALRDRRGWLGARRGSVSYHLLTQATGPVLAYPPEWARALRNAKRRKPL
jgi:nucleotide-binding universal stress UspA family protein